MFARPRYSATKCILLILTGFFYTAAHALELGKTSLMYMPAEALSSVTFSTAHSSFRAFAMAVGGVAFTTTASSIDGSSIKQLRYDASAPDGSRLIAQMRRPDGTVGGYTISVPDWIQIPLARYVASGSDGAVTLFGSLKDKAAERKLRDEQDAMIANYNPALKNTLIGLRLLQADMLVFVKESTDLFRDHGQYILGAGERAPTAKTLKANEKSFERVQAWIDHQPERFQSYVTGDIGSKVTYSLGHKKKLELRGEPSWYCWRQDSDKIDSIAMQHLADLSSDAFVILTMDRLETQEQEEYDILRGASGKSTAPKNDKLKQIMIGLRADDLKLWAKNINERPIRHGDEMTLINQKDLISALTSPDWMQLEALFDNAKENFKKDPTKAKRIAEELRQWKIGIRNDIEKTPLVQMVRYSHRLSTLVHNERGINPTIYHALEASVRVSAFLRAAKKANPDVFRHYIASIAAVTPKIKNPPGYKLETPTVFPRVH